jgi:hypothetical protein
LGWKNMALRAEVKSSDFLKAVQRMAFRKSSGLIQMRKALTLCLRLEDAAQRDRNAKAKRGG